jgi:hypothetical protein
MEKSEAERSLTRRWPEEGTLVHELETGHACPPDCAQPTRQARASASCNYEKHYRSDNLGKLLTLGKDIVIGTVISNLRYRVYGEIRIRDVAEGKS